MIRLLSGHVVEKLRELAAESIHCVVTSPPYYGLRDYGIEPQVWGGDAGCGHEWGDDIVRKQLSGGDNEWSNDRYLRADGAASTVPASKSVFCCRCGAWRGSLGLEPTLDLYLEHMFEVCREIWRVMRSDATCWMNLGDSYLNKQLQLIPSRLALRLQEDGWWVRSEIVWAKAAPMPESVADRPTSAHEKIFLLTKSARYFYDAEAVKEDAQDGPGTHRGGSLFRAATQGNGDPFVSQQNHGGGIESLLSTGKRNLRNVWHLGPSPFPEAHFATFSPEVPRRCIMAGSKPGDTILDPFAGAGTTLLVADQLQRDAIGIELNPGYAEMARRRLEADNSLFLEMAAE